MTEASPVTTMSVYAAEASIVVTGLASVMLLYHFLTCLIPTSGVEYKP